MPRFSYNAVDKSGKRVSAIDEAKDEEALVSKLQAQGIFVVHVLPLDTETENKIFANLAKKKVITHARVKLSDLVIFSRQLATMLDSGVTLLKSLDIILQQVESKKLLDTLIQVKTDLEQGLSFSSALAKHPKVFNQFWVSLAEVGEASGTLPLILEKLAYYMEVKAAFQAKVISALLYPAILFTVCIGAMAFFALKIIPTFTGIFKNFGIKLPLLTQIILDIFNFIRVKFLIIVGAIVVGIILFRQYIKNPAGRKQFEGILLKLPILGNFFRIFLVERFTSQLSILVESGVPILYALEISQRMVGNLTMEEVIAQVKNNVREGKFIAEPMSASGFFPPMVVQMILIGEETGELAKMLKKVAFFYQNFVETFLVRFTTIFEPLMIVFMGFVVATIVISMFLPIFSISTLGGGADSFK